MRHVPLRHATRSMAPHHDAAALLELRRLFRDLRPDVVHTHNPKPGVYGRLAARAARVPAIVNTVHGLYALPDDPLGEARRRLRARARRRDGRRDAELVQNPEDVPTLRRLGIAAAQDHRARQRRRPRAVPARPARRRPRAGHARAEWGADDDTVVVGAVGRLVWEKGYRELFAAAGRSPGTGRGSGSSSSAGSTRRRPTSSAPTTSPPSSATPTSSSLGLPRRRRRPLRRDGPLRARVVPRGLPARGDGGRGERAARWSPPTSAAAGRWSTTAAPGCSSRRATPTRSAAADRAGSPTTPRPAPRWATAALAKARAEFDDRRVVATTLATYDRAAGGRAVIAPRGARRRPRPTSPRSPRSTPTASARVPLAASGPAFLRRLYRRVLALRRRLRARRDRRPTTRPAVVGFVAGVGERRRALPPVPRARRRRRRRARRAAPGARRAARRRDAPVPGGDRRPARRRDPRGRGRGDRRPGRASAARSSAPRPPSSPQRRRDHGQGRHHRRQRAALAMYRACGFVTDDRRRGARRPRVGGAGVDGLVAARRRARRRRWCSPRSPASVALPYRHRRPARRPQDPAGPGRLPRWRRGVPRRARAARSSPASRSCSCPPGMALALGLADDLRPLPVSGRVVVELAIAVDAARSSCPVPLLVRVATAVLVLGLLNAVNLLDGQDGLAAGVGVVIARRLRAARRRGHADRARPRRRARRVPRVQPAAGAHLPRRRRRVLRRHDDRAPARAHRARRDRRGPSGGRSRSSSGLPVADTAIAILRRLRAHRPLLQGDRSHVYDQLVDRGHDGRAVDARRHRRAGRAHRRSGSRPPRRRRRSRSAITLATAVRARGRRRRAPGLLDAAPRLSAPRHRRPRPRRAGAGAPGRRRDAPDEPPGRTRFESPSSPPSAAPTTSAGIRGAERGTAVGLEPGDPRAVRDQQHVDPDEHERRTRASTARATTAPRGAGAARVRPARRGTGRARPAAPTIEPGPAVALGRADPHQERDPGRDAARAEPARPAAATRTGRAGSRRRRAGGSAPCRARSRRRRTP